MPTGLARMVPLHEHVSAIRQRHPIHQCIPADASFRRGRLRDVQQSACTLACSVSHSDHALANYPDTGSNTYSNRYIGDQAIVIDDNVAACEARYRSYDASTGLYLGYDGNYHPCRL